MSEDRAFLYTLIVHFEIIVGIVRIWRPFFHLLLKYETDIVFNLSGVFPFLC